MTYKELPITEQDDIFLAEAHQKLQNLLKPSDLNIETQENRYFSLYERMRRITTLATECATIYRIKLNIKGKDDGSASNKQTTE